MAVPSQTDDAKAVICAIRLGWAVAEIRARLLGGGGQPDTTAPPHTRPVTFLPLAKERTATELAIETSQVVIGLAGGLGLDFELTQLSGETEVGPGKASDRLAQLTRRLTQGNDDQAGAVGRFLYAWDARIQDMLAAGSFGQATGYLLGRGLGEVCWGPELAAAAGDAGDWSPFLGEKRCAELVQSLERLSAYFDPLTVVAVRSSLAEWQKVADDKDWHRQEGMSRALKEQSQLWRDLLLGSRDPASLVTAHWSPRKTWTEFQVVVAFLPQIVGAVVGVALLSGSAWILANPNTSHNLGAVLAVLGLFGVTGAGLNARAKNSALQLISRLRLAYERDLVAEQATRVPAKLTVRVVRSAPTTTAVDATATRPAPVAEEGGNHANESSTPSREQSEEVTAGQSRY